MYFLVPGSGKSTVAERFKKYDDHTIVINTDTTPNIKYDRNTRIGVFNSTMPLLAEHQYSSTQLIKSIIESINCKCNLQLDIDSPTIVADLVDVFTNKKHPIRLVVDGVCAYKLLLSNDIGNKLIHQLKQHDLFRAIYMHTPQHLRFIRKADQKAAVSTCDYKWYGSTTNYLVMLNALFTGEAELSFEAASQSDFIIFNY